VLFHLPSTCFLVSFRAVSGCSGSLNFAHSEMGWTPPLEEVLPLTLEGVVMIPGAEHWEIRTVHFNDGQDPIA